MPVEQGFVPDWRRIALDPPRAHGAPPASGVVRVDAADFVVEEILGFEPDGGAAHLLVRVEKENANTLFVARRLADRAGVALADIGFAGLKDRRAVARQWFSVPAAKGAASVEGAEGEGFRVLSVHPHSRKLKRGALAENGFRIRVRELAGDPEAVEKRARELAASGAPNYFGSQRFGVEGANLARVGDWLVSGRLPRGRTARGFLLSSARALLFNAVLGARVGAGTWDQLLPGEVVSLAGSRSVFVAGAPDDDLQRRCAEGDVSPSGPLAGSGGVQPEGRAALAERSALGPLDPLADRLAALEMRSERRALVVRPRRLACRFESGLLELSFALPRGAFATSLLRELVDAAVAEPDSE
jgi:tRNA pseudouridine13 synthase